MTGLADYVRQLDEAHPSPADGAETHATATNADSGPAKSTTTRRGSRDRRTHVPVPQPTPIPQNSLEETMTRVELLAALRAAQDDGDQEAGHLDADMALLTYIDDPEVTEAYKAIDRWYA